MKLIERVDKIIDSIGCISFALIILLTSSNVVTGWLFGSRFAQIDELVNTFFVWVTYVSAGLLYKNGEQISVDFLVNMMPPKTQKVCKICVDVFTMILSAIVTGLAWKLTAKSFVKTTPVLHIPFSYIDFALVVGFFTLIAYIIATMIIHIKELKGGEENN